MKEEFKKSYDRFKAIDGKNYSTHSSLPWGVLGNSYMMQATRKEDGQPVFIQLMPNGAGYFVFLPETLFPTEQEMDEKWTDGFTCALQLLVISNDHQTAKMLIDESNIDVQEFIEAQRRSGSWDDIMQQFFNAYFPGDNHIKFTAIEWEIIEHRLEAPDALADALEEDGFGRDAVYDACEALINTEGEFNYAALAKVEKAVLRDACNGSVFMACAQAAVNEHSDREEYEISPQKYTAYDMACDRIEEKLGNVSVPRS